MTDLLTPDARADLASRSADWLLDRLPAEYALPAEDEDEGEDAGLMAGEPACEAA